MGSIYEHAYVTIAATAASSSSEGFLKKRPTAYETSIPYSLTSECKSERSGVIHFRYPSRSNFTDLLDASQWSSRGWCFQEQLLSPRTLYFTNDVVYFECRVAQNLEDNAYDMPYPLWIPWIQQPDSKRPQVVAPPFREPKGSESNRVPYTNWYWVAERYAERNLTFSDDRLPALSGLARRMAQFSKDKYLAGLWLGDITAGMLWYPKNHSCMKALSTYRAPSWSWAGVEGEIEFDRYAPPLEYVIKVVSAETTPSGPDIMGRVLSGKLVIEGRLLPLQNIVDMPVLPLGKSRLQGETEGWATLDMETTFTMERRIEALAVAREAAPGNDGPSGLLLEPVGGDSEELYRRVGIFKCNYSKFADVSPRVIKIV